MERSHLFSRNLPLVCHDLRHDGGNPKKRLNGVLRGRNLIPTKQCYGVRLVATRKMPFSDAFSRIIALYHLTPHSRLSKCYKATKRCTAW